jgi:hypothetical protein
MSLRKCAYCSDRFDLDSMIVGPVQAFCCFDHLNKYSKATKKKPRPVNKAKKVINDNSLSHQTELTQKAFNGLIRELDKGQACVSCGKPAGSYNLTAGHFRTVGGFPELRFVAANCHGQCSGCNSGQQQKFKGDNATTRDKFTKEIGRRHGIELVFWLLGPHQPALYSIDDLKRIRKVFSAETRRIEKGGLPSRNWRYLC